MDEVNDAQDICNIPTVSSDGTTLDMNNETQDNNDQQTAIGLESTSAKLTGIDPAVELVNKSSTIKDCKINKDLSIQSENKEPIIRNAPERTEKCDVQCVSEEITIDLSEHEITGSHEVGSDTSPEIENSKQNTPQNLDANQTYIGPFPAEYLTDHNYSTVKEKTQDTLAGEIKQAKIEADSQENLLHRSQNVIKVDDSDTSDSSTDDDSSSISSDSSTEIILEEEAESVNKNKEINNSKVDQVSTIFKELLLDNTTDTQDSAFVMPANARLEKLGSVAKIIENKMVLVRAIAGRPALNLGSLLFLQDQTVLGKVLETFGPVVSPFYVLCPNLQEENQLTINQDIFYLPRKGEITSFILTSQLTKSKGSDASWLGDNEPPAECLDYSDDEAERTAKQQKKQQRKRKVATETEQAPAPRAIAPPQRQNNENWHNRSHTFSAPRQRPPNNLWMNPQRMGHPGPQPFFNPWQQHHRGAHPNQPPPFPQQMLQNFRQPPPPPPSFDFPPNQFFNHR